MLTMTMPNGQSGEPDAGDHYTNTYDDTGRVLTQTDPKGQETTYAYSGDNFSDSGGTTTITDPDGVVTTEDYADGQMIDSTIGSATTSLNYDQSTFGQTEVQNPDANVTTAAYDDDGNQTSTTSALGNTTTSSYNSFNEQTCVAQPLAANPCSSLSPPAAITAGTATITPPSSAPPPYVTYTEYDTDGNEIYQTTGDYAPGSDTASQSRTTYDLYNGQSVTLDSVDDSCTNTAPSSELPCATINANGVVTQLAYDSHGDVTSSATPDGNSGGELATTTHTYDTDGEQTSTVSPNGNLSGANAGNFTTTTAYNADGKKTSVTVGAGSGHTVVPRVTTYTYDADNNVTATARSTSPNLVGTTSGSNSSSSLALSLPSGTKPGDEAVLTTTTSASPSGLVPATADDIYAIAGNGTSGSAGVGGQAGVAELAGPETSVSDAAGDLYVATDANCVDEIPAISGTQWGQSMTAGDLYTVAGTCGTSGHTGDGAAATSALLDSPQGLALDANGDLYIADSFNNRVQEVAATTHSQWGQSMTANDIYTVAGSSSGSSGHSGDAGAATSALLDNPTAVVLDGSGNFYVDDATNNRIQEVASATGTQWGQSMTADDIYTVAGNSSGTSGNTGNGGAATSAKTRQPPGPERRCSRRPRHRRLGEQRRPRGAIERGVGDRVSHDTVGLHPR
jgi:YD repeat-containing protein